MSHSSQIGNEKGQIDGGVVDVRVLQDEPDRKLDVAGKFLAEVALRSNANELLEEPTAAEERAVVRRADFIIVPLLLVALMMGAVDKNALGTAAVLGLRTDLNLVGQQYSWTSSIIFFGSLASLFPALFFMQKYPAGKVIAANVTVWGIISMATAGSKAFGGLAACRFILGLFEALTFPGFSLVISSWYTRREQSFKVARTAIIYSTLSSLTNGLLSFACSYITDQLAIKGWQLLFILVGAITFSWGILMGFFLPDSPVSARWLTERQRVVAVMRLKNNQTGVENKTYKLYQVKEALLDPKTWLVFFTNICLNVPTFNSIIVASLGFTSRETTLLSIPTGLISWVSSLAFSYIAVKTKQRTLTAMFSCFIPLLSTILLHVIPRSNVGGSLGSLFIIYFYWAPYIVMSTVVIANTGGYTKKTIVYGIAYCGYLVGNIIGPQTFIATQAPDYTGGVVAMLVCYCVAIILIFTYHLNIRRLNKKKAAWMQANPDHASGDLLADWRDLTDFEKPTFIYVI
ncbi:putative allantoate permease [Naematelia encephala]|uniref:Putative allantoate permease n=1 Tax=Naematelia encephala TaxID=71784 RepID=A0A1Y2AG93_9TREE|nr:putative allantoate permease [Naematelia encephala]